MPLPDRGSPDGEGCTQVVATTGATETAAAVRAVGPAGIVLAGAILLVVALPTEAQWSVEESSENAVARTVGLDGRLHVVVGCHGGAQVVTLRMPGGAAFSGGSVEAQWDDGSTERYRFQEENGILRGSATSPQVRVLIGKISQHRTVRLLAMGARNEEVTDRINRRLSHKLQRSRQGVCAFLGSGGPRIRGSSWVPERSSSVEQVELQEALSAHAPGHLVGEFQRMRAADGRSGDPDLRHDQHCARCRQSS